MGNTNSQNATFLAADSFIRGDMHFNSPTHLAGHIEGRVEADDTLEIAPTAVIDGDVSAALIEIHGTVKGNILASRACRLGPTARVTGEIRAANLAIAEGASFVGQVVVGSDSPATAAIHNTTELFAPAPSTTPAPAPIANPQPAPLPTTQPTSHDHPPLRPESPITFPSRIEQIVREEEPALASAPVTSDNLTTASPSVRIMTQNVQQTLQRGPRIIKAR